MATGRKARLLVAAVFLVAAGVIGFIGSGMLADDEAQSPSPLETYEDRLLRIAREVPGFGGMFIDQDGRLAVYLLDTTELAIAESAIAAVFGPQVVPPAGTKALQGQYTILELIQWRRQAIEILTLPGVSLVGLDEAANRVRVGVEDATRVGAVEQALQRLGIPREAVIIEVTGPITPVRSP